MLLTDEEKRMYGGEYGPGVQKSMTLLVKYGTLFGAERMAPVHSAHITTRVPTEFVSEMTEGTKVRTLSTLHSDFDPARFGELGITGIKKGQLIAGGYGMTDPAVFRERIGVFRKAGFLQLFTCTPYIVGVLPRPGDVMVWTGSSGQIACNSVFAARANREGASSAVASAVTGKAPYMGLLIKENRYADMLFELDGLDPANFTLADYGALGYYIGSVAGDRNIVINGLPGNLSVSQCRFLTSPMPVSGAVAMCHIVGVTPEAPTLEEALGKKKPKETVVVGEKELKEAWGNLNTADSNEVDLVTAGCPHLTILEIKELASLIEGKKLASGVRLIIGASMMTLVLARREGHADVIEKAGGIFTEACVGPMNPPVFMGDNPARVVATNSARAAHYIFRTSGGSAKVLYGDIKKCIDSAVTGKWGG